MSKKKLVVSTDITDWMNRTRSEEVTIESEDDIIALSQSGMSSMEIARHYIVNRELGVNGIPDVLGSNKQFMNNGAAAQVGSRILSTRKQTVTLKNGEEITFRELIGKAGRKPVVDGKEDDTVEVHLESPVESEVEPDDHDGFVSYDDPLAIQRTLDRVKRRLPGRIWEPFKVVAAQGGDVKELADFLHKKIDDFVEKLT